MTPIIQVQNVSKYYRRNAVSAKTFHEELSVSCQKLKARLTGDQQPPDVEIFKALEDVSFNIMPGEVVGIIGSNGAGKSTLLKILSRITMPTSGSITMHGRVASLLEVGTGFHPELTGRENIFMNGAILGMKRSEILSKFDEIVEFSEVGKFIDTPVKRYSSGMYVRLAFAVAAHLEPEILIIDEVLAVGDAAFQKKCLNRMHSVATNEGKTILFVSHNATAIGNLCARCIYFDKGRLVAEGSPSKMLAMYAKETRVASPLVQGLNMPIRGKGVHLLSCKLPTRVSNGEVVELTLALEVESSLGLAVSIQVSRNSALCFSAKSYHQPEFKTITPGNYTLQLTIPTYLLNPGPHQVGLILGNLNTHEYLIQSENLGAFEVVDDGFRRDSFNGDWNGAVSPILPYKLKPQTI